MIRACPPAGSIGTLTIQQLIDHTTGGFIQPLRSTDSIQRKSSQNRCTRFGSCLGNSGQKVRTQPWHQSIEPLLQGQVGMKTFSIQSFNQQLKPLDLSEDQCSCWAMTVVQRVICVGVTLGFRWASLSFGRGDERFPWL